MSDEYETVHIDFEAEDKITPKLTKMERQIARLGQRVDQASNRFKGMLSQTAMFAGFFALGPAIAGAKNYIDHLDKISDLTGMAADKVGGISNALEDSGVSASTVESVFGKLVKKGAKLGEGSKQLVKQAKAYGIELKGGPQEALTQIADKMEQGKLSVGGMQRLLGLSSNEASEMADAMSQGGTALNKKIEEATAKNSAFTDDAMDGWQRFQNSVHSIGTSWNRMTASIAIKLAPALEKLASKFEHSIDGWAEKAAKFGEFLVDHMDQLIAGAKIYAKIMFTNMALQKLTGAGIGGNIVRMNKGVGRAGGFIRGVAGKGVAGNMSGISGILSSFFGGALKLRPIIASLGRLSIIGVVIGAAVFAFSKLGDKTSGIGRALGRIIDTVSRIGETLGRMFSGDSPLGRMLEWLGTKFLGIVETIAGIFETIIEGLEIAATMISERTGVTGAKNIIYKKKMGTAWTDSGLEALYKAGRTPDYNWDGTAMTKTKATLEQKKAFAEFDQARAKYEKMGGPSMWGEDHLKAMRAKYGGYKKKSQSTPENMVYQDFRGSRFDIKQAFAEGYDPDRIAVAFAHDVAGLGERKLQSGFAPLFSVSR